MLVPQMVYGLVPYTTCVQYRYSVIRRWACVLMANPKCMNPGSWARPRALLAEPTRTLAKQGCQGRHDQHVGDLLLSITSSFAFTSCQRIDRLTARKPDMIVHRSVRLVGFCIGLAFSAAGQHEKRSVLTDLSGGYSHSWSLGSEYLETYTHFPSLIFRTSQYR